MMAELSGEENVASRKKIITYKVYVNQVLSSLIYVLIIVFGY